MKTIASPFFMFVGACALSLGWLLPNHYQPWLAFHCDAWVALILLVGAAGLIWRTDGPCDWHWATVIVGLVMVIPAAQILAGQVVSAGVAWVSIAYLLGFLLALLISARWEKHSPRQLMDALFLAIGLAAILSVGLQLQQWLQVDGFELLSMGGGAARPHANLGQPNQLGTLLLWGVLSAGWAWLRGYVRATTAVLMALYLLVGLALTGSRTAWLGLTLLLVAVWVWRRVWPSPCAVWVSTALAAYFALCIWTLAWGAPYLLDEVSIDGSVAITSASSGQVRIAAWQMFGDAIGQHPWLGYGWNQTAAAHMAVAVDHPALEGVFTFAHNLFIDLLLWCGVPLGLLLIVCIVGWTWRNLRAVQNPETAILMMILLVVGNHAMLEMPLYYAYFLLPVGLVVGTVNVRHKAKVVFKTARREMVLVWLGAAVLLVLLVRDYVEIEPAYRNMRFEQMRIKVRPMEPPDVVLLTQLRDQISISRMTPGTSIEAAEIAEIEKLVTTRPSTLLAHKLATVLALNHQPEGARQWLKRLCKFSSAEQCQTAEKIWAKQSLTHPEIAAIPFPLGP